MPARCARLRATKKRGVACGGSRVTKGGLYNPAADLSNIGSCHLLRHAMATHTLESGVNIRFIRAARKHTGIATAQVYTDIRAVRTSIRLRIWRDSGERPDIELVSNIGGPW